MQIKYKKGGTYEHLYPKTLSENVEMNDGDSVEQWKQEVDDDLNGLKELKDKIEEGFPELWKGAKLMDTDDEVKPNQKLSDCFTGWVLAWKQTGRLSQYQYTLIPKIHLIVSEGTSAGTKTVLSTQGGAVVIKFIYIKNDVITGHSSNASSDNEDIELVGVYEF